MKCLIIDDEPLAIDVIEYYLKKIEGVEIVATCTNPLDAIEILSKNKVDLIFLDIEMPNITGVELVKILDHVPQFIFTTAYSEYALEGFELNATDYLVKPISFNRFLKAVNRARRKFESDQKVITGSKVSTETLPVMEGESFFFVRSDYENIKIYIEDVKFLEGLKDYIKIHLQNSKKPILTLSNFNDILEKLPSSRFLRVHRSFVVNINHISALQKSRLFLGDIKIPIGETYKKSVLQRLKL